MRSVGIDIGTSSIKVVEVATSSRGVQVLSFHEHPLGQNPAHDSEIEIIEFLQGIALQYDTATTKVVMSIRQERVSVRHKLFPFTDRVKILKSLPFELEEDLPFSQETAVYEARTTRVLGNQAEVLACAVPKHRIAEMLERFQSTGLQIGLVTAEGLALANCYEHWWEPIPVLPARPFELEASALPLRDLRLVIQLGHTHTIVSAFEGHQLVAVRSILWGGRNIAESIARKYEIPYIEALREMRTKAFILPNKEGATYDQIVFSDTIAAQVRELGRELKLSILEIETELNGKIQTAETSGGLAGILHLGPYLTQLIEVPVNPSNYLQNFNTQFEKTAALENSIGTALGLALEGLRKPRNPAVQFLRGEFAPQNESLQLLWQTWGLSLKVAAAMFAVFLVYAFTRESLSASLLERTQDALKDQAETVAHLPSKPMNENGIKKYIREKRKRAQDMKALQGLSKMNSALEILRRISEASPQRANINLVVQAIQVEDQNVSISGTVGNAQERTALQRSLQALAKDGKVNSREGGSAAPGMLGIPFAFNFSVDRGIEATR